jgi:hypothetical protein
MIAGEVDLTDQFHLGGFAKQVPNSEAYPESERNWMLGGTCRITGAAPVGAAGAPG